MYYNDNNGAFMSAFTYYRMEIFFLYIHILCMSYVYNIRNKSIYMGSEKPRTENELNSTENVNFPT